MYFLRNSQDVTIFQSLFWLTVCICLQCSKTCGTGEQYRSAECMDIVGRRVDDSKCPQQDRVVTRTCNSAECPYWTEGHWSAVRAILSTHCLNFSCLASLLLLIYYYIIIIVVVVCLLSLCVGFELSVNWKRWSNLRGLKQKMQTNGPQINHSTLYACAENEKRSLTRWLDL